MKKNDSQLRILYPVKISIKAENWMKSYMQGLNIFTSHSFLRKPLECGFHQNDWINQERRWLGIQEMRWSKEEIKAILTVMVKEDPRITTLLQTLRATNLDCRNRMKGSEEMFQKQKQKNKEIEQRNWEMCLKLLKDLFCWHGVWG